MMLIKSVFNENHNHYYYKVILEKYLYKYCKKCYITLELKFLKILMLIRQAHQNNLLFATTSIF